jgi:membrane-associated phospholipid phosphatase
MARLLRIGTRCSRWLWGPRILSRRHFSKTRDTWDIAQTCEEHFILPLNTVTRAPGTGPLVSWPVDLWQRLSRLWYIKATFTTLGIGGFFIAYFWVMRHPVSPVTVMPLTVVDRAIPFQPGSLYVYLSLWVYVSLAPALLKSHRELTSYGLATSVLSGVGLAIFLIWPTAVPPSDIDWSLYPSIAFLKDSDQAMNACPSMHVAFAVFTAMWLARVLREMGAGAVLLSINGAWCLAIIYSTIATRQHVALDVVAGAALGWCVAAGHMRAVPPAKLTR